MRKVVIAALATALTVGSTAMAVGTVRDNCGCGLGTMALGDLEPTLLVQMGATFINSIFGNQTFGITSGTLDCGPHAGLASNRQIKQFVSENMDHLAMDMATGNGEALSALADLMEVPAADRPALFVQMQNGFEMVFDSEHVTADEVLTNLDELLRS